MNIIHFSHCNLGGTEASTAHVMEFADRLASRGHSVVVVSPKWRRPYPKKTLCKMVYFRAIHVKGLRQITGFISGFFTLLRLKFTFGPDCLYIRRLALDPMPGVFAWLTRTPLVTETNGQVEIHEHEVPIHALWKPLWYPMLLLFERIVFSNSYAVTADGDQRLGNFRKRYRAWGDDHFHMVRSGGIDLDRFHAIDKQEAREKLKLPQDKRLLIWVGTIFAWSGLEVLLEAAKKVCSEQKDVDILMVGDGPERARFIRMAKQMGLSEQVRFTGYIQSEELYLWLSASDLALAPYTRLRLDREDFTSYKIFEYIACGLPVVCSYERGGSNIRYVRDYDFGTTVPPDDPELFANAVCETLEKKELYSDAFVKRARAKLRDLDVTWEALVDQVEDLCQKAAARH